MIGIYKITSPSGRVYIGQSVNITKRFYAYNSNSSKEQPRLHNSFLKYGVKNHVFEIIELTDFDLLNERERYWQEFYDVTGVYGLNCQLTNTNEKKIVVSEYTKSKHRKRCGENHPSWGMKRTIQQRERMSKAQRGIKRPPMSEETKAKLSVIRTGIKNPFYGKKHTQKTIEIIRKKNTGFKHSEETKNKLRVKRSDEYKNNLRNNHHLSKPILDNNTGIFYLSCSDLARIYNFNLSTISRKLSGYRKNDTQFTYV